MYELLKKMKGPDSKDPRKLLANVWILRDETTGFSNKMEHPCVMIETRHHPDLIYKTCLISSHKDWKILDSNVFLPAGTIDQEGKWSLPSYVKILAVTPLPESSIDKGLHKCDLPEKLKCEVENKIRKYRKGR